jgi:hypothetical protein
VSQISRKKWRAFRTLMRRLPPPPTFHTITVPVIDGIATLPDGRTVETTAKLVSVPVLDRGLWG